MLKRFKHLFSRPASTPVSEDPLRDDDILRDDFSPSAETLDALAEFVRLVGSPCGQAEADQIADSVRTGDLPGDDIAGLLTWSLARNLGDGAPWTLAISVDWKAWDEIEWQAEKLLDTLGIGARWEWARAEAERTVADGLLDFGAWLRPHGYELLHVDTGGDDYFAFPIRADLLQEARLYAERAGLKIEQADDFRASQGLSL
ncbi:MAG: hypothetical protein QM625_03900 [Ralstonia sp.]|uniref:DUF6630 domain-containing protein n=1 Tax=Ralstonia pickettii TaxID=329 RepID=A0A9Q3LUT8_RALPI|nr:MULTISPECIES: hypothetical protein [Ralstonia]KFL24314.1 hypothetical protein DP23_4030 [Ralstonia pickettii]MBA9848104.1 hypothetical protein [Ralstonia pickettii]MBA9853615.1 hypothetical protein [Ralstonia pickettii]MBA9879635.1 hypothetical protein [Ralstonia pickettii]MBA9884608.1 hypothetical protein [Ralstonia pickettii]